MAVTRAKKVENVEKLGKDLQNVSTVIVTTYSKLTVAQDYELRKVLRSSGAPNKDKVGKVTEKQVADIAKQKMPDLNAASLEAAIKSVKGTARSMGIDVVA